MTRPTCFHHLEGVHVLAVKLRRLGDTVLWTSALEALRQIPNTKVDIAFPEEYEALFTQDPRFERKFAIPKRRSQKLQKFYSLRQHQYDAVLNFHASSASALLCALVGGKERIFHSHRRLKQSLGSTREIPNLGIPQAATERDLNVVRALGWQGDPPETKLYWENAQTTHRSKPLLVISPFASRPSKQWPLERYARLSQRLVEKWDVALIAQSAVPILFPKDVQVFQTPSLPEALNFLRDASFFVGSDSGLKHAACALGIPTLTLFGPESVGEWHCYRSSRHSFLQHPVGCRNRDPEPPEFSWCGEEVCPLSSHACMNLISVDEVFDRISQSS